MNEQDSGGFNVRNKRARADYTVLEKVEAGIELVGSEVKSLRNRNCSFTDSYVVFRNEQAFLENFHVGEYSHAGRFNHVPKRTRRLLLKKTEIRALMGKIQRQGLTVIPLSIYTKGRWIKLELGLARGKRMHDKRQDLAKRESDREIQRALKERNR